jgi:endoglucanase
MKACPHGFFNLWVINQDGRTAAHVIIMHKKNFLVHAAWLASLIFLGTGCSNDSLHPMGPDDTNPPTGLNSYTVNTKLGRGMNLGNALEAPNEGDWSVVLQSEYFDLIKSAGFSSVRIPIRWSTHAAADSPYTISRSFFDRVDWAIGQAFAQKLPVVINIHHYEEIMQTPAGHKERFLALWSQIADHYKNYSGDLVFEILNEPNTGLTVELWNQYLSEAITAIRQTNPGRTLMVGPANWYSITTLSSLALPADDRNLIVSVHYYSPFAFTHQGAEWVAGSNAWLGTTWQGTAVEKQAVIGDLSAAASWGAAHDWPINVGEFGAYSKADIASRARWTDFVARTAESKNMSWHYWEFIAGFGAYNGAANAWNPSLLTALIPQPPS